MAKNTLANNLKNLLEKHGKTQTDMARDLDLHESTVSSWMNAAKYPRRDKVELMADYFNVMPSDLTDEHKEEPKTLAAHLEGSDYTQEELDKILEFAEMVRKSRDR